MALLKFISLFVFPHGDNPSQQGGDFPLICQQSFVVTWVKFEAFLQHFKIAAQHYENTWITLTTFLGCLSCISVTKECMLPNWFY